MAINYAVVSSKDLGTYCWLPRRFIKRTRCDRVLTCKYPEKKTCQAVLAEIDFLSEEISNVQERSKQKVQEIGQLINQLMNERR
jgi:hypothetical protein